MNGGKERPVFFPLFFRVSGGKTLVVGGGKVALRKVEMLLDFGADITLVAPEAVEELKQLAKTGKIVWRQRRYLRPEARGYDLIIATTDDPETNQVIHRDAAAARVPLNVVDQPELCSVIFPAIVRRGDFILAMGSGGKAPFFTRAMKERLEEFIPQDLQAKAELAGLFRNMVMDKCADSAKKAMMFKTFLQKLDTDFNHWKSDLVKARVEWESWLEQGDE